MMISCHVIFFPNQINRLSENKCERILSTYCRWRFYESRGHYF